MGELNPTWSPFLPALCPWSVGCRGTRGGGRRSKQVLLRLAGLTGSRLGNSIPPTPSERDMAVQAHPAGLGEAAVQGGWLWGTGQQSEREPDLLAVLASWLLRQENRLPGDERHGTRPGRKGNWHCPGAWSAS